MDHSRIEGTSTKVAGKLEKAVGDAIGDEKLQSEGLIDQIKGTTQEFYGSAKDSVKSALETVSPAVRDGAYRAVGAARAHPVLSAVLAGVVGYGIALALSQDAAARPKVKARKTKA